MDSSMPERGARNGAFGMNAPFFGPSRPLADRFNEKWTPEPFSGCHLWTGTTSGCLGSYGKIKRCSGGPMVQAHRIAWELAHGPIPPRMWVLHNCDTKMCVNPLHLRLGTPADNTADARERGQMVCGERNHSAKLTASDVRAIRVMAHLQSRRSIAGQFGVTKTMVGLILQGKKWKSVK